MASFRRNTAAMQRDGSGKRWSSYMVPPPSPKVACSRTSLAIGRFVNSWIPVDIVLWFTKLNSTCMFVLSGRHPRSQERCRTKGLSWKRVMFHLFAFFMVGVIIGSTPFFSIDLSQNFALENERFPSDGKAASGSQNKLDDAPKEVKLVEIAAINKSNSLLNELEQRNKLQGNEIRSLEVQEELNANVNHHSDWKNSVASLEEMDLIDEPPKKEIIRWEMRNDSVSTLYPVNNSDIIVRKLLIVITITSVRPLQSYYLTRLAHVLKSVAQPLLWIVSEWPERTNETAKILRASRVMYRHLTCDRNLTNARKIAVCQKNIALFHVKKHRLDGILHFADESTVYSSDLFKEMREIRRFGTWPVAFQWDSRGRVALEGPLCMGTKVIGWQANQRRASSRRFPIGFSGFAFNSTILWDRERWWRPTSESIIIHSSGKDGLQESRFIEKLVEDERQVETLGGNCSNIMAWSFSIEAPNFNYPASWSLSENLEAVTAVA